MFCELTNKVFAFSLTPPYWFSFVLSSHIFFFTNTHKKNILTMAIRLRTRTAPIILLMYLGVLIQSSSFVVHPHYEHQTRFMTAVEMAPLMDDNSSPTKQQGPLAKLGNAIAKLFTRKPIDDVKDIDRDEIIVSPHKQEQQQLDIFRPFPWPIRTVGQSITRSIHRELAKEQRHAKPLLKEAQRRIKQDKDLRVVLGEPIHIKQIFSSSSSTSIINGKKTRSIVDEVEVVGSKNSGIATIQADMHAKGHLKSLRVDVGGIHYDVEI